MPSPPVEDYYALLGVATGADGEELSRAFRQLALRWHPDRAGDGTTAIFQQLSAAYAVLSDPVARAAYDRRRRAAMPAGKSPESPAQASRPPERPVRRSAPAIMLSRLSGPLPSLIACGVARLDEPGFITLVLSEAEAAQGGMATVSLNVELRCPDCATLPDAAGCPRCGGKRTVPELFSAWLSVPPGVTDGEVLAPSVELPDTVTPVRFRVRLRGPK